VEPVTVGNDDAKVVVVDNDATTGAGEDADAQPDAVDAAIGTANVGGGLWVVDGAGQPVGVLISRGALSTSGTLDLLRDHAVVYSPKAGIFFTLQMSTGKIVAPRLGVSDTTCTGLAVAGYYANTDQPTSGQNYAFVYKDQWYRIADYKPAALVTCGGTVPEGVDAKCAPHAGSCTGFPVATFAPPLPTSFSAPMAFSWLAK
jgi:hypothetical protein